MTLNINNIIEQEIQKFLDEDYPESFDMEFFKSLSSFNKRIQYCDQHLQKLKSGSGRIAYKIDDEKVLKLAKNQKGVAQNEEEIGGSKDYYIKDLVAQVFDYDEDNYLWLEMELARPLTMPLFKQIVGVDFNVFGEFIRLYDMERNSRRHANLLRKRFDEEFIEYMWDENEFVRDILDYIGSYDIPVGDLTRKSTYGVVKHNGEDRVVIIDYGLSQEVFDTHYMKRK